MKRTGRDGVAVMLRLDKVDIDRLDELAALIGGQRATAMRYLVRLFGDVAISELNRTTKASTVRRVRQ